MLAWSRPWQTASQRTSACRALCKAYIRALAASLQLGVTEIENDFDSVDFQIIARGYLMYNGKQGKMRSPQLGMQLKCTYAQQPTAAGLTYKISRKNYDDLRSTDNNLRRTLVVVSCPRDWPTRLCWTPESMIARHAAYWATLEGAARDQLPSACSAASRASREATAPLDCKF